METTNTKLCTLRITGVIGKFGQHLYIIQTTYTHSDSTTKERPSFNSMSPLSKYTKRSLLPFLGDAFSWLTGTAMIKDVRDIKMRVNQLIETQTQQQYILVHVILILNITRYAMQVNRQQSMQLWK